MKIIRIVISILFVSLFSCASSGTLISQDGQLGSLHNFIVKDIYGSDFDLQSVAGKKVMIVNTASKCGFTPQFETLELLYNTYMDKGFTIIGFPSNDFFQQDPGSDSEILEFCQENYGVTFPMMSKVNVTGDMRAPLYKWLTQKQVNGVVDVDIQWNFQKFLINEDGSIYMVLPPSTSPDDPVIIAWIES